MRVALVHDYLNQYGGAERVLEALRELFPDAPIYTIIHTPENLPPRFRDWDIRTSFLNDLPFVKKHYEKYLPLFPLAVESFNFDEYDLVISDSSAWVKGIITGPGTLHISYCYTPMRFAWDMYHLTLENKGKFYRRLLIPVLHYLRTWDVASSRRVDHFIAISTIVKERIKKYYGRDADVVYCPVDTETFTPDPSTKKEDFFLVVSRLKPYKRIDIAIEAFNRLGLPLVIIGDGPEKGRLMRMARPNIHFLGDMKGREGDKIIASYYRRAQALIFPTLEDFGIVPLEAQACGTPVIAFRGGGAVESVIEGKTGTFFHPQSPEALVEAVKRFDPGKFDPDVLVKHAKKFGKEEFKKKIKRIVDREYRKFLERKKRFLP